MSPKSKNYKWQLKWIVDLKMATVTHLEGLRFEVDVDQNGKLEFLINKEGKSLEYYENKMEKLHFSQVVEHLCRMERQARKIYQQKVLQEIEV